MSRLTELPPIVGQFAMSASSLAMYRECPRKYELAFLRQLSPEKSRAPFLIGTAVHDGLEMFYRKVHPKKIIEEVQDRLYAALRAQFIPMEEMADLDKEASIVAGMLLGYFKHYGPAEWERWPDAKTEIGFDFLWKDKETPNWGQIDLAGTYKPDGLFWVVEHKTTGMSGNDFLEKWHLGFQPHNYVWAAHVMYRLGFIPKPPVGCCINVLKKPGIRRKKDETQEQFNDRLMNEFVANHDKYMVREWIPISLKDLEWYEKTQGAWVEKLKADVKAGYFPQNTDSCHSHYGACQFWPICRMGDRDPGIYQYFRVKETQFEEVKSVTASDR